MDAIVVLISVIVTMSWFIEKTELFTGIIVMLTMLGDLIFLMGNNL